MNHNPFVLLSCLVFLGGMTLQAGPVRRHEVYAPDIERGYIYESNLDGLAYNHCPTVLWFRDRWIAAWNANPLPGEPMPGHEITISTSRDGRTWSAPHTPFSDAAHSEEPYRYPEAKQWQPVFILVEDELWSFFNQSSPDLGERGAHFARLADPDGRWSLRRLDWGVTGGRVRLLDKDWAVFPSQNPVRLRCGRIVVPVVLTTGRAPDAPEAMQGWWANERRASVIYSDDLGETWSVSPGCTPEGRSWAPWEPTVWEQSDGSLAMVFRHNAHPAQVEEMPSAAQFMYGAISRDRGKTWSRPEFVPLETVCSRMYVAPLDGAGIWNPVAADADYAGRLHLMLHHDFPGGQGWSQDRRDLALFFRRGDGFEFTAGPSFSGLEPRAVYPQHAVHDGTLLIAYTQSHLEKRSIRYAHITPLPDPGKRYLLPRADVVPDPRPLHEGSLLRFESLARQQVTARTAPPLTDGTVALAAWLRPDCRGLIWDNRVDAQEGTPSGFAWGIAWSGSTQDRAAPLVLSLQWSDDRLLSRLPLRQGQWNYVALEVDAPAGKVRFYVGDRVEEQEIPAASFAPGGGAGVVGAARKAQSRNEGSSFHGDLRCLALFDRLPGAEQLMVLHDRLAAERGAEALGEGRTVTLEPVLELDPSDRRALARDFAFPEEGFQGVRAVRHQGRAAWRFTGEGSMGVDVDENHRRRGDRVWLRFRVRPEQGRELVLCTVGDANDPARVVWRENEVYLRTNDREERVGPARQGRWTTIEVATAGTWTEAMAGESGPVRVRHAPQGTWVYLGQGYRTGQASDRDAFLLDTDSVESRVTTASPPPRALFNNDGLGGGIAQQRSWGAALGPDASIDDCLRAAVDEMAGLGPHLFAPGDGWVVWWQSREYPMEEHARWLQSMGFESTTLRVPGEQTTYVLEGGDLVRDFVEHARNTDVPPFVTFRMNDYHWSEYLWLPEHLQREVLFGKSHWPLARISRFLVEHWDYRIGPASEEFLAAAGNDEEMLAIVQASQRRWPLRHRGVLDWAQPEVRAHKLAFLRELAAYDIDGIELDFMRHSNFFKDDFPEEDRIRIMTGFLRKVRHALDEAAPEGRRRTLVARVPLRLSQMPQLGIDLEAFVDAGLDYVNLSQHFMTTPDSDLAEVVRRLPGTPVYLEMTQARGRRDGVWRLVTPEQLATAAHVTYARGGAGLSYFNIQYYRAGRDQASRDGIRVDIPFETMRAITDPQRAAAMPQHYFVGPGNNVPRAEGARQLPRTLERGQPVTVRMDCAPPAGGWQNTGRLRAEGRHPWEDRSVTLTVNGVPCLSTDDVGEPFPGPYHNPASAAQPGHLRAWIVPPGLLVDGENEIRIDLEEGTDILIDFIDLAFP